MCTYEFYLFALIALVFYLFVLWCIVCINSQVIHFLPHLGFLLDKSNYVSLLFRARQAKKDKGKILGMWMLYSIMLKVMVVSKFSE